jgi:hypothetical protein
MQTFLTNQPDGSNTNMGGWAYYAHERFAQKQPFGIPPHTLQYTFMNFAAGGATLTRPGVWHNFPQDCHYHLMQESLPHAVFLGFGAMETQLKDYSEEAYIRAYLNLIEEVRNMPTKPILYMMVPLFGCEQGNKYIGFIGEKKGGAKEWMKPKAGACDEADHAILARDTALKVAKKAGIPDSRVLNTWDLLRGEKAKIKGGMAGDNVHPNKIGHEELGKIVFKMMTNDEELKERVHKLAAGTDEDYNKAVEQALSTPSIK